MPSDIPAPSSDNITSSALAQLLSIYPNVLQTIYRYKVKGDNKARQEALEDDEWRYKQLHAAVTQGKTVRGISKEELERLVKWKITHQTHRPFLLPQIRKNDSDSVEKCTAEAGSILVSASSSSASSNPTSPSHDQIRTALAKVCELKGVGPATGTLILSVYDGQNIPFFEDELYAWLLPDVKEKLKYNNKEYFQMLSRFQEISKRASETGERTGRLADAYEKASFVCMHWDLVTDAEKRKIDGLLANDKSEKKTSTSKATVAKVSQKGAKASDQPLEKKPQTKRKRVEPEQNTVPRRSERSKKPRV